jgi:hypothetical protein
MHTSAILVREDQMDLCNETTLFFPPGLLGAGIAVEDCNFINFILIMKCGLLEHWIPESHRSS